MTTRKNNTEKAVHFGTISMPIAKGLYTNGNYSLIMILAYLDSRKQKQGEGGYQYPYEYNAPDIHYNTGVGLKMVNKHLRMLKLRGALELIKDTNDRPIRTKMGALKYRVVKAVYEREWGPNSRGAKVLNEEHSQPSANNTNLLNEGHPEPSVNDPGTEQAGHSGPSVKAGQSEPGAESRAISAHREGHSEPSVDAAVGLPRPSVKALRSGHSAPTNDNERIREEKSCEKREDGSGSTFASPPLNAPASATVPPAQEGGEKLSKDQGVRSSARNDSGSTKSTATASGSGSASASVTNADPLDPVYGIPVSYVRRYEKHADSLNRYLKDHPQVGEQIAKVSDAEAGRIIMHLLDILELD